MLQHQSATSPDSASLSFAIVVPCHNREFVIAETLHSLRQQRDGLQNIAAVYLSDDHSTDDTINVAVAAWEGCKVPLHVVQPPRNLGTYGNTNHVIESVSARHDWVLLLHDDDMAASDWVTHLVQQARSCRSDVASLCSSYDVLYADGRVEHGENTSRPVERIDGSGRSARNTLLRGCWWHVSGCAIRTQAFAAVGPFDPELPQCSDWEWVIRCLAEGWAIDYIPRALTIYRQHDQTVTSRSFRLDRDLHETLTIAARHQQYLSVLDIVRLHSMVIQYSTRRVLRGVVDRRMSRIRNASHVAVRALLHGSRLVAARTFGL